jgi:hypothetical protein
MSNSSVNEVLRDLKGLPDNNFIMRLLGGNPYIMCKYLCISHLDDMCKTHSEQGEKEIEPGLFVYHGITKPSLLFIEKCIGKRKDNEFLSEKCTNNKNFQNELIDYGYIHASRDIQVAMNFSGDNCCVLKFRIPKDLKYLVCDDIENQSKISVGDPDMKEIFIQRNVVFSNFMYIRFDYCRFKKDRKIAKIQCDIKPYPVSISNFFL